MELRRGGRPWSFVGAHLSCTYVCGSGIHWNNRGRGWEKTEAALEDVRWFLSLDAPGYLENPVGIISTRIRKPSQIIQPYHFGADASKATCLWLKNVPSLQIDWSKRVAPRYVCPDCKTTSTEDQARRWFDQNGYARCHRCQTTPRLRQRWANQTDSGQNKLAPSDDRWKERSRTYPGIAAAMANQWGPLIP